MNRLSIAIIGFVLLAATAAPLRAQTPAPNGELVDRVVAVVGDSAVLRTDIDEELLRLAASGQTLPEDPAALQQMRRQVLESKIDQLLLVQAAARDSVQVPEARVQQMVEQDLTRRQRAFGGQRAFTDALRKQGFSPDEYREILTQEYRRSALVQQYVAAVQRERQPPPVTEDELRSFFEQRKDQLGDRPATIEFEQVVIAPEPSDSARAAARAKAEEALQKLREGSDFDPIAKQYSDDTGTRDQGGRLGWFRRGEMVPEFEDVAFALRPGQTSGIVETQYGFHIIRVDRIKGAERQARHILVSPTMTSADRDRARALSDMVIDEIRGGTPIDTLRDRYGDPSEQGRVGPYPRDQLPGPYAQALGAAEDGDIVGPVQLPGQGDQDKWAVIKVTDVKDAGAYALDDVRRQVRRELQRQKLLDELVAELRRQTYVDIRM